MWRLAHFSYGLPSHLLLMDRGQLVTSILSEEGVRQGDVLGPALFALSMKELYSSSTEGCEEVCAVAIMDDLYFGGRPKVALQCFSRDSRNPPLRRSAELEASNFVKEGCKFLEL